MKKFLIASTALTLSAGVAAAEVTFSGDARFGLAYNNAPALGDSNWVGGTGNDSNTRLEKRYTLNIDASTTADNGVTFGARVRLRNEERANATSGANTMVSTSRMFARYQGFEVAAGNILGAIESAPSMYSRGISLTGLSWGSVVTNIDRTAGGLNNGMSAWDAFASGTGGAEGIEVLYSAGDFKGHVSYSDADLRGASGNQSALGAWGSYKFNGWTATLGFQDTDSGNDTNNNIVFASIDGKVQDFGIGFAVAQVGKGSYDAASGAGKVTKYVLNGSYAMGATTLGAHVATQSEAPIGAGAGKGTTKTSYGLGASYNLGGGASVVGGIERTTRKTTRADLGVSFRF